MVKSPSGTLFNLQIGEGKPYLIASLAALLIIIARRPGALLNPQFWAEDGRVWYADAYNHGVVYSLTTPENGYLQTFSRLVAIVSQLFPLKYGPLIFVLVAIAVQVGTALFIISPRMSAVIPDRRWRWLLAFLYLAMPHSWEIYANITNSQWHLGLLACLVLLSTPAANRSWKILDLVLIALSAVSGPFCVLLLPVAIVQFARRREALGLGLIAILTVGIVIQGWAYLTFGREVKPQLGADFDLFLRIMGRQVFLGPVIGARGFRQVENLSVWNDFFVVLVNLVGFGLLIFAILRSSPEVRLLILFAILIIAAALASPAVTIQPGQWEVMADNDVAFRYWFIPSFAAYTVFIYFAGRNQPALIRCTSVTLLLTTFIGIVGDWKLPAFQDLEFQRYAAEFEAAPPETVFTIPINPNCEMTLVKK